MSHMATMSIPANLSVSGISVAWLVHCGREMEMGAIRKAGSESESNKFRPGTAYPAHTQSNLNLTTSLSIETSQDMVKVSPKMSIFHLRPVYLLKMCIYSGFDNVLPCRVQSKDRNGQRQRQYAIQ